MAEEKKKVDDEDSEEEQPKKSKKKLIIIVALILVCGGGGAGYFLFMNKPHAAVKVEKKKEIKNEGPIFLDMKDFTVDLAKVGNSKTNNFLRLSVTLEVNNKKDADKIVTYMPRIRDIFQPYLRELRKEDLRGAQGFYKLKEDLILRINKATYPATVNDILIKEMVVN